MSKRFEIRIGQTWYVRGSKGDEAKTPCDVYIEIQDIHITDLGGELKTVLYYRLTRDGKVEEDHGIGFSDLIEQLYEKDWALVEGIPSGTKTAVTDLIQSAYTEQGGEGEAGARILK